MAIRSVFVALLGIAVAGGSAYGAKQYMDMQAAAGRAAADPAATLTKLVVATQDIPFGVPITTQMLRYQTWPVAALPSGAFQDMTALVKAAADPRRAKFAMPEGQPILASQVSDFGEKVTLVQTLGPNSRAMAIKVDAETAVGGFVTPGDHVDVILTQGSNADLRSVTILQNLRVLGVDQQSDQQTDTVVVARTVTVEVTPEESQKLALAQKAGTLSLSLRTLDNVSDEPMGSTTISDLIQSPSPAPVAANKRTVTVRRGNSEVEVVDVTN